MSKIQFDDRGREILSDMPVAFNVPVRPSISTLDFHRQRLLDQREAVRRMIEEMKYDNEHETYAEANDFAIEDPFDESIATASDFELDDDTVDPAHRILEEALREDPVKTGNENVTSTETQSPPESA